MVWEDWLASVAPVLGVTTSQAGVMLALLFTFVFVLMAGLATPKKGGSFGITLTGLIFTFFFTYIEWYPIWTGTALSLVLSWGAAIALKDVFKS